MGVYTVAISGASGAPYALRVLQELARGGHRLYVSITREGRSIVHDETGLLLKGTAAEIQQSLAEAVRSGKDQLRYFDEDDLYATISSGSAPVDAMVVVPCSMKTLAAIAHGFASNLIERAADVTLKERRKLVIVPRETPLSAIHLRNMLTLAEAGAHMIPAMPAFYHHPKNTQDMVDFIAGRVLDALGLENDLSPRWGS